jgi:hypothetical protein
MDVAKHPRMLLFRCFLVSAVSLVACVESSPDPTTPPTTPTAVTCASAPVDTWSGDADRVNGDYPDDAAANVTWRRTATTGCVDRYEPTGTVRYSYAVPGALCAQEMAPGDHAIAAADGWLEIDRSTTPATYRGHAATTWSVTWTCHLDSGDETQTFDGGGTWFDAAGTVGARVEGTQTVEDGRQCGRGQSSQPCEYTWGFDAGA